MRSPTPYAAAKPKGKLGLVLGIVAALALGGGGFYAVYAGILDPGKLVGGSGGDGGEHGTGRCERARRRRLRGDGADHDLAAARRGAKHLRFAGQLEVAPERATAVDGS